MSKHSKNYLNISHSPSDGYNQLLMQNEANSDIGQKLILLLKSVIKKRPTLQPLLEELGPQNLYTISESYAASPSTIKDEKRKIEFISVFKDEVAKILGSDIAESAAKQIAKHYYISTAEHHAPVTHPNYVNSNVHASLFRSESKNQDLENVIVLACANISFDNYAIPRGLLFHSYTNHERKMNQLVFFPRKVRPLPVIHHEAYKEDAIQNAKKRIDDWLRTNEISPKDAEKLYFLLDKIYAKKEVLNLTTYSDQITLTNFMLWKALFSHLDKYAPNLIFLEQEKVVLRLLSEKHLYSDSVINKILFNEEYHSLLQKYFDGIMGGFSLTNKQGTYLFWALPPGQKYRTQLWKNGSRLTTADGTYSVELTPEGINGAIERKELIPSTLLSFILLNFYYGVQLRGWADQTLYLTQMKQSYIEMMQELGDMDSIRNCIDIPTNGLSMVRPALAFLSCPNNIRVPATTIDILLYGNDRTWETMKQNAKQITFKEAFFRALPSLYRSTHEPEELQDDLLSIKMKDINKATGLSEKIVSCAKME